MLILLYHSWNIVLDDKALVNPITFSKGEQKEP